MNTTMNHKVVKARSALILDHPFFGSLSLRLQLVEDYTIPTMATNGKVLKYNPDFVETLTPDETRGLCMHEVLHPALGHHVRRGQRDLKIWNEACDYAVNNIVLESGGKLPAGGLVDSSFKNMAVEDIYNHIKDRPRQPQGPGDVEDMPGDEDGEPTEQQKQEEAANWQVAATQAAQQAKKQGNLPASLDRMVADLNSPKVNWKEVLQRFVEQVSKNDYNWSKPNKRHIQRGIVLPSLYSIELPPIHVWIDTSSSVGEDDLKQFASEIDDLLAHYPTTITVVYCDSDVAGVEEFTKENRPVVFHAKGGGGTRFSPAIKYSMDSDEHPCCGIYLTDMECSDFGPQPDFPVLWVATEPTRDTPPFGELINMHHII